MISLLITIIASHLTILVNWCGSNIIKHNNFRVLFCLKLLGDHRRLFLDLRHKDLLGISGFENLPETPNTRDLLIRGTDINFYSKAIKKSTEI